MASGLAGGCLGGASTPTPAPEPTTERFETDSPRCFDGPTDAATVAVDGWTVTVEGRVGISCGDDVALDDVTAEGGTVRVAIEYLVSQNAVVCSYACAHSVPYRLVATPPAEPRRVEVVYDGYPVTTWTG